MATKEEQARARANAQFERAQSQAREAEAAKNLRESQGQKDREKTAQLRALRLAKEAADAEAAAKKTPRGPAKKTG